jgi:hypothetical protein
MELQVDSETGTARFAHYYQEVDALTLPGGLSTGNLTIEILEGSSTGTYDYLTGEFTTSETYLVYFEGDLSAFGLESPVAMPGESLGTVQFDGTDGAIILDWDGAGMLMNPFSPGEYIDFSYFCTLNAQFAPDAITLVELALVPTVENLSLAIAVEDDLLTRLAAVEAALDAGDQLLAWVRLRAFGTTVASYAGNEIAQDDADYLIGLTDAIADMIYPGVFADVIRPTKLQR